MVAQPIHKLQYLSDPSVMIKANLHRQYLPLYGTNEKWN